MKILRALLLGSVPSLACLPALRAATVDSHLTAVTVYADRAVVTRTAAADLTDGEHTLVFERLPAALLDQSLQVSGRGTATATMLDVAARQTYVDFTPNARVQELEEQIRGLKQQQRALDDRTAILTQEHAFVQRMLTASTGTVIYPLGVDPTRAGGTAARPTLEEWQKLYTYSEDTFGKIAAERQTIDRQREDLQAKAAALQQQLAELRGAGGRSFKTVAVRVAVTAPGRLEVALKYAVPGASWAPSYDARLHSAGRTIALGYFGLVRNNTGEDWKDVALTLSTARPNLGGGAPELRPWIVDIAPPRPVDLPVAKGMLRMEESRRAADKLQTFNVQAASGAPSAVEREVGILAAAVEAGATSATFKVPMNVTLPADNTVQRVPITSVKLAANLQYQATPKLMETAFLTASASNTTDYPFLAGAMNTFLDDTFVASSRLKTVMPGEKFELQLGADEGIGIKRRLVNRFAEDTGLVSKSHRITYDYLITITNNKPSAERVVFKEPVPVSRNEKIEVSMITPAERDLGTKEKPREVTREENGQLVWRLDLKPGEKREIPLKFAVEYPVDLKVTGLE